MDKQEYNGSEYLSENPDTEKEQVYQKLLYLMECADFMTDYGKKADAYRQMASGFKRLKGYRQSADYTALCLDYAKQSKKQLKKSIYKSALQMKNDAKTARDYRSAAELFRKIPGYREADSMASECDKISDRMETKIIYRLWGKKLAVFLLAVLIILGLSTSHAKYYVANAYMQMGSYESAIEKYKKLGDYKDSRNRLLECRYLDAGKKAAEGHYKEAAQEYAAAGDYKDSAMQMVAAQQNMIKNSKPGKKVKIGKYDWIILDIRDDRVFLMKSSSMSKMPYHSEEGEITWEKTSLRQWLNAEFMEKSFAAAEKRNILLTEVKNNDNETYKTIGGSDTRDYVFLLSIQEAKEYGHLFPDFKTNTWLRSPGAYPDSAAFLSENGAVMEYGYKADNHEFMIRPVMWYKLD